LWYQIIWQNFPEIRKLIWICTKFFFINNFLKNKKNCQQNNTICSKTFLWITIEHFVPCSWGH
jgi:hypothetical protein